MGLQINPLTGTIQNDAGGGITLDPGATDLVTISTGVLFPDGTMTEPSVRFEDDTNTGLYSPINDTVALSGAGGDIARFNGVTSSVNYLDVKPSVTTGPVLLSVAGTDANIDVSISGKGTGKVKLSGLNYPTADAAANTYVKTDGIGNLSLSQIAYSELSGTPTLVTAIDDLSDVTITTPATDQVLAYNGTAWVNAVAGTASPLTTKGDIYTYSTTEDRLPVGIDTQVLTADSTAPTGVKWATPSTSGGVTGTVASIDFGTITGSGNANIDAGSLV